MEAFINRIRANNWKNAASSAKALLKNASGTSSNLLEASRILVELSRTLENEPVVDELCQTFCFCYDFILKHTVPQKRGEGQVDRCVYFVLEYLIKTTKETGRGLLLASTFLEDLRARSMLSQNTGKKNQSVHIYSSHCYLLIWNQALVVEQNVDLYDRIEVALDMRLEALRFLALDHDSCMIKITTQASRAADCVNYKSSSIGGLPQRAESFYAVVFQLLRERIQSTAVWPAKTDAPLLVKQVISLLVSWVTLLQRMGLNSDGAVMVARAIVTDPVLQLDKIVLDNAELCLDLVQLIDLWKLVSSDTAARIDRCSQRLKEFGDDPAFSSLVNSCFVLLHKQLSAFPSVVQDGRLLVDYSARLVQLLATQVRHRERHFELKRGRDPKVDECKELLSIHSVFNISLMVQHKVLTLPITTVDVGSQEAFWLLMEETLSRYLRVCVFYDCDIKSSIVYVMNCSVVSIGIGIKSFYPKIQSVLAIFSDILKRIVVAYRSEFAELRPRIVYCLEMPAKFMCEDKHYVESLNWVAQFLAFDNDFHTELFARWMSVKRNVKLEKITSISEITVIDVLPKFAVLTCKSSNLTELAKEELRLYLQFPSFYKHESCALLTKSLMIMSDPLDKANAWIKLAKLQLMVKEDLSHSPKDCVKEAMRLLDIVQTCPLDRGEYTRQLIELCVAEANFVRCFVEFAACMSGNGIPTPPTVQSSKKLNPLNDLVDELDTCDDSVEYLHLTMSVENGILAALIRALDLWTSVIAEMPGSILDLPGLLVDLKMTAEMFAVKRMVVNEIRSWRLVLSVGLMSRNDTACALATARLAGHLARLGFLVKADEYLEQQPVLANVENDEKMEIEQARLVLLLAKSELQLMKNEVNEGWQTLQTAYQQTKLLPNIYSCQVLTCETMLLASKYSELPNSVLQQTEFKSSPIQWAILGYFQFSKILKWPVNQDKLVSSQMRYRVLGGLFETSLRLGRLYHDIGAPREARCYLRDQLYWAKYMLLANRSAELLLILARLDILSGNFDDCLTKISNVDFIMRWEGLERTCQDDSGADETASGVISGDLLTDDYRIQKCESPLSTLPAAVAPPEAASAMSPDLVSKKRLGKPFWVLEHGECKECCKCGESIFLQLCLELSMVEAECHVAIDATKDKVVSPAPLQRTLDHARRLLLAKEAHVAQRIFELVGEVIPEERLTKTMRLPNSCRPLLETELTLCHSYNRLALLYLEFGDPSVSSVVIGNSSDILEALPWKGIGRIYNMKAFVKYLKCVVEIRHASCTMQSARNFNRLLGAVWPHSQAGCEDNFDVDYITKKVASIEVKSRLLSATSSCATPKPIGGVGASSKSPNASSSSGGPPHYGMLNGKAPVKKRPFKLIFQHEHGYASDIVSSEEDVTPEIKKEQGIIDGKLCRPETATATSLELANLKSEVIADMKIVEVDAKKVGGRKGSAAPARPTATVSSRKQRVAKENVTAATRKRVTSKKVIVYEDEISDSSDGSSTPVKKRALSRPRLDRIKKEQEEASQPLSPSKCTNRVTGKDRQVAGAAISKSRLKAASTMAKYKLERSVFEFDEDSDIQLSPPLPVGTAKRTTRSSARSTKLAASNVTKRKASVKPVRSRASRSKTGTKLPSQFEASPLSSPQVETVLVRSRQSMEEHSIATLDLPDTLAFATSSAHQFFGLTDVVPPSVRCSSRLPFNSISRMCGRNKLPSTTDDEYETKDGDLDIAVCSEPTVVVSEEEDGNEVAMSSIISCLEDAIQLINHHPSVPLYGAIHSLLALCKGEHSGDLMHHLSEVMAVTLRHTAAHRFMTIQKKLSGSVDNAERVNDLAHRYKAVAFQDDFQVTQLRETLPAGWTVCQITVASLYEFERPSQKFKNSEIILTRLRRDLPPVSAKLSYQSYTTLTKFINEMENIFADNSLAKGETVSSKWWEVRREIDNRIMMLVSSLEKTLLGHWKGFLLGSPSDDSNQISLHTVVAKLKKKLAQYPFGKINEHLLEVIVDSFEVLSLSQRLRAVASLCLLPLNHHLLEKVCQDFEFETKRLVSSKWTRQHLILVLHKDIQGFPWENLPMLRQHSVSRMPSLHFVMAHLQRFSEFPCLQERGCLEIDSSSVSYVLNPGSDLKKSELRMKLFFDSLSWTGLSGVPPTMEQWSKSLTDHELFVYCGHGAGSKYMGGEAIQNLDCKAVVLLFGCSSGALRQTGRYVDPHGIVHNYILAGSPCVLGNLWDVTDNEIDNFTTATCKRFLPDQKETTTLGLAATMARAACQLKYLTGAAPVIYGFPVVSKSQTK